MDQQMPSAAVEMREVRKDFGDVVALDGVDLTIHRGQIVGIIGPSGAGKTTAIRLLLGIYAPTSGEVRVLGHDPSGFRRRDREQIGYLPQGFVLYPDLSVRENLNFIAGTYGLGWLRRRRRIPYLLSLLHLSDAAGRLAQDISGGMQRRLELAAALVHDPALLVLDEPTAGLDPVLRAEVWDIFRDLQRLERTIVVTTQYVTEAEYCDAVVLIDGGRVIAAGSPEALREQAFGGEIVRVTIPGLNWRITEEILSYPFVMGGERGGDELRLIVEDAGETIPLLAERLRERGHPVSAIEEHRESFDRVFVRLVEHRGAGAATVA